VIIRVVDVGGSDDYRCLSFLFIIYHSYFKGHTQIHLSLSFVKIIALDVFS